MSQRPSLNLTPERRQIMTFALRQALEILQMTQLDLAQWLTKEIEKNPLLELDGFYGKRKFAGELIAPVPLYDHIQTQIRENFLNDEERKMAQEFVEHLDEKGFITCSLEEVSKLFNRSAKQVLTTLQTFDPPGIFARNLQESLLIQLKAKGKENTLASQLIEKCFEDLLNGRYGNIKKKLKRTDLREAINDLSSLTMRPAQVFKQEPITPIYPDLRLEKVDGGWTLELIEDELPKFHIQTEYLEIEAESEEEYEALRTFKTQAKWIFRSLSRRRKMLKELGRILVCKQAAFLDQKKPLKTLTIKELSEKLGIHESTLSRALAGKYMSTPRGIIPLRSLISSDPSAKNAKDLLEKLIRNEDKKNPLTDDQLAKELKTNGFQVARRTISKYRSLLKIGSASQRKHSS